jgi:hypothetical protein
MRRKARSLYLLPLIFVALAIVMLYEVWQSPQRSGLSTFWSLAIAVGVSLVSLSAWVVRRSWQVPAIDTARLADLADQLAAQVSDQWTRAASDRGLVQHEPIPVRWRVPKAALAGSNTAAAASQRFGPFPGLQSVGVDQLAAGDINDLHAVYGGLGSGRLVIAGAPGSGKSSAGVVLVRRALAYRAQATADQRLRIPVLVMFTLEGWDPEIVPVMDWLMAMLRLTYSVLAARTGSGLIRRMIDDGLIAVVLDGLDEIAEHLRPVALEALSQQVAFRLVLLTRSDEMAAAVAASPLDGAAAVELQGVDAASAANYLLQAQLDPVPQQWLELASRLLAAPAGPLAQALSNPLALTLVRDTFRGPVYARQLLAFCDAASQSTSPEQVMDQLLDRVLPAAYAARPGRRRQRHDVATAMRTLGYIANLMDQAGTRELKWWQLLEWAPSVPRAVVTWLVCGLVGGVVGALAGEAISSMGVVLGVVFGLIVVYSVLAVSASGQAATASGRRADAWGPLTPVTSWRSDLMSGLKAAILAAAAGGAAVGALFAAASTSTVAMILGSGVALAVAIVTAIVSTATWSVCLVFAQLSVRHGTPIRLLSFLEGARKQNVLRTVGPVYQFRHARLQDRLAEHAESRRIPADIKAENVLSPEAGLSAGS